MGLHLLNINLHAFVSQICRLDKHLVFTVHCRKHTFVRHCQCHSDASVECSGLKTVVLNKEIFCVLCLSPTFANAGKSCAQTPQTSISGVIKDYT